MNGIETQGLGNEISSKQQEILRIPLLDPTFLNKTPNTNPVSTIKSPLDRGAYDQLNQLFGEQDEQHKTILEAREILEEEAEKLNDEQVYNLVSEVKYLLETWFEEFERSIFDGQTLNEVFNLNQR